MGVSGVMELDTITAPSEESSGLIGLIRERHTIHERRKELILQDERMKELILQENPVKYNPRKPNPKLWTRGTYVLFKLREGPKLTLGRVMAVGGSNGSSYARVNYDDFGESKQIKLYLSGQNWNSRMA